MDEARRDSINKSKRSRNEQLNQTVSAYLQKRNYPDIQPMEINEDQMNLSSLVNSEVSRSNSVSYTCLNSDPMVIDHSFLKFVSWLKDLHSKSKDYQDLDYVVAPLFCHLYIELLQNTHKDKDIPGNFFKFHLPTVEKIRCNDFIKALLNSIANDTLECHSLKKKFRSNKFYVNLTPKSVSLLKKYLSENSHVVLLQVLQTWFQINEDETDDSDMEVETIKNKFNGYTTEGRTAALKKIQDIIDAVRNEPAPIYQVELSYTKDEVDCGVMNRNLGIVAYSSNSSIYIASLLTLKQLDNVPKVGEVVLTEHSEVVYDLALMNNNKYLVSASEDKLVKLFDLNNYSLINTYKGHDLPVYKVKASPNNAYIVSGSSDNACRLWSIDSKETLRLYAGHTQEITALAFHPHSMYFISGSADKTIRMWSIADGLPLRLILGSKGAIYAAQFSPTGKYLATAGEDKRIRIWDVVASKQIVEVKVGNDIITKLAWGSNDAMICSGSIDGSIKVWDVNTLMSNPENTQIGCVNTINLDLKLLSVEFAFDTFGCLTYDIEME